MSADWEEKKLGEISEMCLGKMLDKKKNKGDFEPYLANYNVRWGKFDLANLQMMRFEKKEQNRYGLEYGDLIICEGGEPGRCAIWRNEVPDMKIQKALHRVRLFPNYSYDYLYYRFLLAGKNNGLKKYFIGSTIKHLTGVGLKQVEFKYPPYTTQNLIGKILRSFDAKIELNNRINSELESMAKLIYDYWFVQFDFPDGDGKPYKSSGGEMVWCEELKREIPLGWSVGTIKKYLNTELGGTPSTENKKYWDGNIHWLNSGEIANFPITDSDEKITFEAVNKSATTLMPKRTCVISITRHLRPSILAIESCANQSVVGIYESSDLKYEYIYPYLKNEIPRLMTLRTGAQQPHINKDTIDESFIINPPTKILKGYYLLTAGMYKKIISVSFQSKELVGLRDWVLPMLMNGQICVGESEE